MGQSHTADLRVEYNPLSKAQPEAGEDEEEVCAKTSQPQPRNLDLNLGSLHPEHDVRALK